MINSPIHIWYSTLPSVYRRCQIVFCTVPRASVCVVLKASNTFYSSQPFFCLPNQSPNLAGVVPVETGLVVDQPLDNHVDCLGLQFLFCLPLQLSLVEASFRHAAKKTTPAMDRSFRRFPRCNGPLPGAFLLCAASADIERRKHSAFTKLATKTKRWWMPCGGPIRATCNVQYHRRKRLFKEITCGRRTAVSLAEVRVRW